MFHLKSQSLDISIREASYISLWSLLGTQKLKRCFVITHLRGLKHKLVMTPALWSRRQWHWLRGESKQTGLWKPLPRTPSPTLRADFIPVTPDFIPVQKIQLCKVADPYIIFHLSFIGHLRHNVISHLKGERHQVKLLLLLESTKHLKKENSPWSLP